MWLTLWCLLIWSGKLWTMLVTSHWRLSPLLSGRLRSLFPSLTTSMVSLREEKSLSWQFIRWAKTMGYAWLALVFLSWCGPYRSVGTRPNSSQCHLSHFRIFVNSSVILKWKQDVGNPALKNCLWISVSGPWSQTYVSVRGRSTGGFMTKYQSISPKE